MIDRDTIVIGDGGDFVSYAGRVIETHQPGCWLDPGPFGCLGGGPGQALGAALARPGSQVVPAARRRRVRLQRDGVGHAGPPPRAGGGVWATTASGDWRSTRWSALYGYSVAADLQPGTALRQGRARSSAATASWSSARRAAAGARAGVRAGGPALVNVLTDPSVAYPRRSNLA